MSWSRSAKGSAADVREQAGKWKDEQKNYDSGQPDGVKQGHAMQIEEAASVIERVIEDYPDKPSYAFSAYGHANSDGSGNVNVGWNFAT